MNQIDLAFMPALELAKLIHKREITPLELTNIYLERIQDLNPKLGSYFTVTAEQAITDAQIKTEMLSQTNALSPLFGLPISIKDLNPVKDVPWSLGVYGLRQQIPEYDDGVVTKIKEAGMIILGKTATSELGSFPYTEPTGFLPARNPWNLDYTPGGSSGGAAAAVAAGLCPFAQGSDGGGSIRGPAACCALVGIKPSRGRVSFAPGGDRFGGVATNGPLGRTVADAAALLDLMSGYMTGDPYWLPEPETSFLSATEKQPGNLRIAFDISVAPFGKADENCQQGVFQTAKLLSELGHEITQASPDISGLLETFPIVWQSGWADSLIPTEILQPMNQWLMSRTVSTGKYLEAFAQMQIVSRQIIAFFDLFDVLVLPVYLHSPIQIGAWSDLSPEETFAKITNWVAPSPIANATGLPAIAFNVGFDSNNNLPIGVQIIGKPAAESTLISLAAQIEATKSQQLVYPMLK
ncbi:MAG: amidase [Cyanobacteria bacterium P01_A01_bin.84]